MLQQAVERNLEIIGQAINNLLKIYPEIQKTNAQKNGGYTQQNNSWI
ncbi:MAG: hypothetical protein JWR54_2958 [Mucilaginibacter sp.]|jgi:uncharacterized protein with HEPN domain|nr:hypothetical protein [Mucilaginibacter sp.]